MKFRRGGCGVSGNQGNPIPGLLTALCFRAVASALWCCAAGSAAFAQNLPSNQVEMWYGVRRIDAAAAVNGQPSQQKDSTVRPPPPANKGQEEISGPLPAASFPKPVEVLHVAA